MYAYVHMFTIAMRTYIYAFLPCVNHDKFLGQEVLQSNHLAS